MVSRYRGVFALPGVAPTMLVMVLARVPQTAIGVTLTLHVVGELGLGFGAAGIVGAATTIGIALGSPVLGRVLDRVGLRPVVLVCGLSSLTFGLLAPLLSYPALLASALPMGLLGLPASSLARQVIAAQVPVEHRRAAYSLDAMAVEVCFMVGPAASVFVSTQFPGGTALRMVGIAYGLAALGLWLLNPPVRTAQEVAEDTGARPPMRSWLNLRLIATLLVVMGSLFVLVGAELTMIAALRANGELAFTGVVFVVVCLASIVGGLWHGAARRSLSQVPLALLLAALTVPVGLLDASWWLLAILLVPSNMACAPAIAATGESISNSTPSSVRGEALGLQSSAMMAGVALGNPVVGLVLDNFGVAAGFAAAGAGGLLFAGVGVLLSRLRPAPSTVDAMQDAPA